MAEAWLRRWLFRMSLALAASLVGLIVVAPWLDGDPKGNARARLVALFASDTTLRRTGLAGAAGLAVTAWIFFQPAGRPVRPSRRSPSDNSGA